MNVMARLKILAIVIGMMAATATVVAAWPARYWVAHRGYVDDVITSHVGPIVPTLRELSKWRIDDSIAKLDEEIANWQIKLPTETDLQTRGMMQSRLADLSNKKAELKQRSQALGTDQ